MLSVWWEQGQASDVKLHAEEMLRMKVRLTELYAKHTGHHFARIGKIADWQAQQLALVGIRSRRAFMPPRQVKLEPAGVNFLQCWPVCGTVLHAHTNSAICPNQDTYAYMSACIVTSSYRLLR